MSQALQYEMKDSGVEWIGEIPKGWDTKRIKSLALSSNSLFLDGDWINSPDISESGIRYFTTGNVGQGFFKEQGNSYITAETFERLACTMVHAGDLIISRLNEPIGRACIIPTKYEDCIVAVDNVILRPDVGYCKKFLMYCMSSDRYAEFTALLARGTTMHRISRMQLGNITLPVPSLPEQEAIASYLDDKCSAIDTIIAEAKATIEEYKAWKASVIFETVTKGLDPNAEMKDSGVEWIGKVPKHWEVSKMKGILRNVSIKGHPNAQVLSLYREFGVIPKDSRDDNHNVTSEDTASYKFVENGDLVINKMKAWQGSLGVSQYEGIVSPAYYVCKFISNGISRKFLHHLIRSKAYAQEFERLSTGMRVGQWDLGIDGFLRVPLLLPPLPEQAAIASYLDDKCAAIDGIIAEKEALIAELESYKKSLIFETVTGKRRVV